MRAGTRDRGRSPRRLRAIGQAAASAWRRARQAGARLTSGGTRAGAASDDELAELTTHFWRAYDERMAAVKFGDVARRFPALVGQAVRLGWQANRRDIVATISLNLISGVFGGYALFATTGVLEALFASGPTPQRVRAALPSLILVAVATAVRSGVATAAGWAQNRLEPQVTQVVEVRLYDLTTQVELAAFDEPDFHDRMQRARDRGVYSASQLVNDVINFVTAFAGLASAAVVVGLLQPILLAVLLLAQLPGAWAAVRTARISYLTRFALVDSYRRKYILADLIAERRTAAELRSFTMRAYLIGRVARLAAYTRSAELRAARQQTATTAIGKALGGIATAGVYTVLGVLLAAGWLALSVAGTAVLALRSAAGSLAAADVLGQPVLRGRPVLLGLHGLLRRRAGPDPAARLGRRAAGLRPHRRVRRHLQLPRRRGAVAARGVGRDRPRRGGRPGGRERIGQDHPGQDPRRAVPAAGGHGVLGRHLNRGRERRAAAGTDRGHRAGSRPLAASVRDNIVMGRLLDESLLAAAVAGSGADAVIAELERGYDTLLARQFKDGAELSGGQWQRIAAARGFYRTAPLLIMDEPTAALDARAEYALFSSLRTLARERTVLLITHRLASVRHADRIYVLAHGKVTESGTHAELMALAGQYAELYTLQASQYETPADPAAARNIC